MKFSELTPLEQVAQIMVRLYELELTDKAGGNVSLCNRTSGIVYITPTGKHKGELEPEDIAMLTLQGDVIESQHKVSSETPFHLRLYNEFEGLKAIIHAHPRGILSWSLLHEVPPINVIPAGGHRLLKDTSMVGYAMPGSEELADIIAAAFRERRNPLILQNHAGLAGGGSLLGAYKRLETLEYCSRMCLRAKQLLNNLSPEEKRGNPSLTLLSEQQLEMHNHLGDRQFEEFEHTITPQETALRKELCYYIRSAYDRTLMMSTTGSFSVRFEDGFLMIPHGEDRLYLTPEDLVFVKDGKTEKGKIPSWYTSLHESIYQKNPDINSVAMAQPPYLMAYAITGVEPIYIKNTIPEAKLNLRDFPVLPFEALSSGEVADAISLDSPALIVRNCGIVSAGTSIEKAYTILECAEPTAAAVNNARCLGPLHTLSPQQITALEQHFLG